MYYLKDAQSKPVKAGCNYNATSDDHTVQRSPLFNGFFFVVPKIQSYNLISRHCTYHPRVKSHLENDCPPQAPKTVVQTVALYNAIKEYRGKKKTRKIESIILPKQNATVKPATL